MGTFFGVTALGPANTFSASLLASLGATSFSDEEFFDAFKAIAAADASIDKTQVFELLHLCYGFEPMPEEINLFVSSLDLNNPGRLSWDQFLEGLATIRSTANKARQNATQYTSAAELQADRRKHVRCKKAPMEIFKQPLTATQEYGWHEEDVYCERFPVRSCAETRYQKALVASGWAS